jgi:hypothetical protein
MERPPPLKRERRPRGRGAALETSNGRGHQDTALAAVPQSARSQIWRPRFDDDVVAVHRLGAGAVAELLLEIGRAANCEGAVATLAAAFSARGAA